MTIEDERIKDMTNGERVREARRTGAVTTLVRALSNEYGIEFDHVVDVTVRADMTAKFVLVKTDENGKRVKDKDGNVELVEVEV